MRHDGSYYGGLAYGYAGFGGQGWAMPVNVVASTDWALAQAMDLSIKAMDMAAAVHYALGTEILWILLNCCPKASI
ncbi:hypothetical protein GW7_19573 [Heterocephalus glaber]|uniref:Uncharacterized protein n=1 Tax=Heterocephalus glaber TaxID=10181 RepID=G5AZV5_HETGA|nr:hypothetical protein GW7_19573 [Heterocephalus glaber]